MKVNYVKEQSPALQCLYWTLLIFFCSYQNGLSWPSHTSFFSISDSFSLSLLSIKYLPVLPSFISILPQISSFATFWTTPVDQQSLGLSIVNVSTGKCCVKELSLCHTQPVAAALMLPGIAQLYEEQVQSSTLQKLPLGWWDPHRHWQQHHHQQGEWRRYNPVPSHGYQFRSQVRNLIIVICPTTCLCCEFYLSLSS